MNRDVLYDPDEVCDLCGKKGAFDFMGDLICPDCLSKDKNEDSENHLEVDNEKKRPKAS